MSRRWRHSRPGWKWLWAACSGGWRSSGGWHIAGGLKLDGHCGPFQPRPFYDSMISLVNANLLSSDSPILLNFFQLLVLLEIPKLREKYV